MINNLSLKLIDIKSKGKFIFENNFYLLNTLGLSGGWAFFSKNKSFYELSKLLTYVTKERIESYLLRNLDHVLFGGNYNRKLAIKKGIIDKKIKYHMIMKKTFLFIEKKKILKEILLLKRNYINAHKRYLFSNGFKNKKIE